MDVQVKYVVCGITDGFGWHLPTWYDTPEEAKARAEHEADREDEVWVEKHTITRQRMWEYHGATLPNLPLIPA